MPESQENITYWRYRPLEDVTLGVPDWLEPGRCYEGLTFSTATGFVMLFEPDGDVIQGVHSHEVELVSEETYRADRPEDE